MEQMERRVFGCKEFSDAIFNTSLCMVEKIFDYILADQHDEVRDNKQQSERVFKIGIYANEKERALDIMCEVFENDEVYQERFKDYFKPDYMKDPIDYYLSHNLQPNVTRYHMGIYPLLNGVFVDHAPVLFERGDHLDVKYTMQRIGKVDFNSYMKFLHEAYKCDALNVDNEFAGTWSFSQ